MTRRPLLTLAGLASCLLMADAMAGLVVTEIAGKAEIEGKGEVGMLAELPDGAQLSLQDGARLVAVHLASGREYVLTGGRAYRITADGPQGEGVNATALPSKDLPDLRLAPDALASPAPLRTRSLSPAQPLLSPTRTVVVTETPIFRWPPGDGAQAYRVVVQRMDGKPHWETQTRETQAALPASHHLSAGEKYRWRLDRMGAAAIGAEQTAEFSVAPAATIRQLEAMKAAPNAPFSRRVLYAALLTEAGAREEARPLWRELAKERPEDRVLQKFADGR